MTYYAAFVVWVGLSFGWTDNHASVYVAPGVHVYDQDQETLVTPLSVEYDGEVSLESRIDAAIVSCMQGC